MKKYKVSAFVGVFEDKLERIRKKLKAELEKPKADRHKADLKRIIKEAKDLRNMVREIRQEHSLEVKCPKCNHKFNI